LKPTKGAPATSAGTSSQKLLPPSTSRVPAAQQKLATAAQGTAGEGTFIVSENGTVVSTSQSRMVQSFQNAGFPSQPTNSAGVQYFLPNGMSVRAMQPTPYAPLRASFENAKGQPVNMDGKTINPPKGTTNTKQYVRERSPVKQTP
jgi:hypothetical protein